MLIRKTEHARKNLMKGNKRSITENDAVWSMRRYKASNILLFITGHFWIISNDFMELISPNIDCIHVCCTVLKEDLRKAARRSADVQTVGS